MLYRDGVIEAHEHSEKADYLYYDKNAVKVFDQKDMPKDDKRFDTSLISRIVMIDKNHLDFFKEVNNTFGKLTKLNETKDLKIHFDRKNKVITLVCQNPFPKSFAAEITKKNLSALDMLSKVNEDSECGKWITKEFESSSSDLFKLNDGTQGKLEYGDNYIRFRCVMCGRVGRKSFHALTRSLQLYLKKYYNENAE
jgi:hypothetical protein